MSETDKDTLADDLARLKGWVRFFPGAETAVELVERFKQHYEARIAELETTILAALNPDLTPYGRVCVLRGVEDIQTVRSTQAERLAQAEARIAALEAENTQWKERVDFLVSVALPQADQPPLPVPVAFAADMHNNDRGFLDVMAWSEGEFNTPLFSEAQMIRAAESRIAALEAAAAHPDDACVDRLAVAMKLKLKHAREVKGRGGWEECDQAYLSALMHDHVRKGDPLDVANFCAFLFAKGWGIAAPQAEQAAPASPTIEISRRHATQGAQREVPDEVIGAMIEAWHYGALGKQERESMRAALAVYLEWSKG